MRTRQNQSLRCQKTQKGDEKETRGEVLARSLGPGWVRSAGGEGGQEIIYRFSVPGKFARTLRGPAERGTPG